MHKFFLAKKLANLAASSLPYSSQLLEPTIAIESLFNKLVSPITYSFLGCFFISNNLCG
jgi:hypothetical protein